MTFQESLEQIRETIEKHGDKLINEEMTKQALILPMIEAWGYDTRNPSEVMAEYPLKLPGGGNGRADYVIMHNDKPAIVIECKSAGVLLDANIHEQMQDYVRASGAAAGVFTDGAQYTCYTDIEEPGRMDLYPYCNVNLLDMDGDESRALSLLAKEFFAPARLRTSAKPLKDKLDRLYDIDSFLKDSPLRDDLFRIGNSRSESHRKEQAGLLSNELRDRIIELVEDIARRQLSGDEAVMTTHEELNAYFMVKGMLQGTIAPSRVGHRDVRSYFSVLVDNNNRKPVCRFYFNGRIWQVGTFDEDKQETKHTIEDLDDIFALAARLRKTARRYADD